ncbi:MAG: zinc ribbon domain-containing protein [Anaerolineae bacterium]|nr:zinc ribbon domain-containing protein [Anaerolineae bacterium]
MPIYTYECEECGVRFDARQKFADDPIAECPECGGYTHRVPQPVGIVFKGSGWYVKDSRGKNNLAVSPKKEAESDDKPDKGDKAAKPDTSPKAASSSDSSPAKKE